MTYFADIDPDHVLAAPRAASYTYRIALAPEQAMNEKNPPRRRWVRGQTEQSSPIRAAESGRPIVLATISKGLVSGVI